MSWRLIDWHYIVIGLRSSVSQRLRSLSLHASTATAAHALRSASTLRVEHHFEFAADSSRDLVLFKRLLDSLEQLLFAVIVLTGLRDKIAGLFVRIALGKLLTERENFLIQVYQETFNRDSQSAFGASFDFFTLYDILLE